MAAQFTSTNGASARAGQPVDGAGDELLAGAVLAGDQHARVGGRDLLDAVEQRADGEAAPDDLVAALDLAAQPRFS
jgi:hypothetical protein